MNTDKRTFNLLLIIIAVIGCICIITVSVTLHRKIKLISKWNNLYVNLEEELRCSEVPPTPKNVFIVQKEYSWLLEKQKEVEGLLRSKKLPVSELTPLEFKEKLLNIETKLKQLASIQGSQIPDDVGFPEYTGGEIPQASEVILLNKQLDIINEITNLLLKHRIDEIISVQRLPYIYYSEGNLYKELVFIVEVRCVFEHLLQVLTDLPKTSFFTVVRNIQLNKVDENVVKAELIIGVVEFS